MAKQLKTTGIYASLVAAIGVDDDGTTVRDFKGAFTPTLDAGVVVEAGPYGVGVRAIQSAGAYAARGISLSPYIEQANTSGVTRTTILIYNNYTITNDQGKYLEEQTNQTNGYWIAGTGTDRAFPALKWQGGIEYTSAKTIKSVRSFIAVARNQSGPEQRFWVMTNGEAMPATPEYTGSRASTNLTPTRYVRIGGSPNGSQDANVFMLLEFSIALTHTQIQTIYESLTGGGSCDCFVPTSATLTGPSTGTTGSASAIFTVTLDAAAVVDVTVTPAGTNGTNTFSPSAPVILAGQSSITFTDTAAADGLHVVSITTSPTLTVPGSVNYTTAAAAAITGPSGAAGASSININAAELQSSAGTWTATGATGNPTLSGTDSAALAISAGGAVTKASGTFDFETKASYSFSVSFPTAGGPITQAVTLSVTNVVEPPSAPTIGTATAGNQTITVPFTPGASGTMPSTIDFTATLSPSGLSKVVASSPATFTSGDGVVNGIAQTAVVKARNSDGFSANSAASNSVTPAAPSAPALSAPTKSTPTATTAVGGFTTAGASGTARMVWTPSAVQPNVAQVKVGQDNTGGTAGVVAPAPVSVTAAGAYSFAAATVTQGLTYYGWIVHTDGLGVDSAVFPLGRVFPGTGRAEADVTTAGWTGSAAGALCDLINEDVRSDATYISSPALSATPSGVTFALSQTYTPGAYTGANAFKIALWADTGVGVARVKFMNSSNVVVGQTADQAVNTTPTLYSLDVTLTANATRWMLEVNS